MPLTRTYSRQELRCWNGVDRSASTEKTHLAFLSSSSIWFSSTSEVHAFRLNLEISQCRRLGFFHCSLSANSLHRTPMAGSRAPTTLHLLARWPVTCGVYQLHIFAESAIRFACTVREAERESVEKPFTAYARRSSFLFRHPAGSLSIRIPQKTPEASQQLRVLANCDAFTHISTIYLKSNMIITFSAFDYSSDRMASIA